MPRGFILTDIVNKKTRSRMMAGIRGKDTKPELLIRRELHKRGFRYRLHVKDLPGKPDLVFPKYHAVIFINGCFWHGHNCHLFRLPKSRTEFWKEKIYGNVKRNKLNIKKLRSMDWRVLTIWECSLKGKTRINTPDLINQVSKWLKSNIHNKEISGRK